MVQRQTRGMWCHAGPFAWGRGSCLELVFARDPWRDAWLTAEEEDAQEQLGDILDRLNAWDASPSVRGSAAHPQPFQKGTNRWVLPFRLPSCLLRCWPERQANLALLFVAHMVLHNHCRDAEAVQTAY